MYKKEIDRWLEGFATDLLIGNERVPLERVIASRLDGFVSLRDQGLTWRAIAALFTRVGGLSIGGEVLQAVGNNEAAQDLQS